MTFGQAIRGHELEIRIRKQVFYSKKYLRVVVLPEELIAETCWYFIHGFLYKQQVPLDTFLNIGGLIFLEYAAQQMFEFHRAVSWRVLSPPAMEGKRLSYTEVWLKTVWLVDFFLICSLLKKCEALTLLMCEKGFPFLPLEMHNVWVLTVCSVQKTATQTWRAVLVACSVPAHPWRSLGWTLLEHLLPQTDSGGCFQHFSVPVSAVRCRNCISIVSAFLYRHTERWWVGILGSLWLVLLYSAFI